MLAAFFRKPWSDTSSLANRSAFLGCLVVVARWLFWPGWPIAALLLAVLVIVPLSLALAAPREEGGAYRIFWTAAVWMQFPTALTVLAATFLNPGDTTVFIVLPWLATTFAIALAGVIRMWRRGFRPLSELAIDFGLIYLGIGGIWTVLAMWGDTALQSTLHSLNSYGETGAAVARFGLQAFGFPHLIIQLTAVHFHYAGLVLPLVTGLVGRKLPGVEANLAAVGVIVGIPLVAVGINLTQVGLPDFEPWAAWLLSASGTLTAVLLLWHAGSLSALPRLFITVSGVSLLLGMVLSSLYAWGRFSGIEIISIPWMLPTHGAINAIGFGLVGLLGWLLAENGKATGGKS